MTEIGSVDLLAGLDHLADAAGEAIRTLRLNHRERLAAFSVDADKQQSAFIEDPAEVIRLIAPAGCGKTQSIANRVLRQISQGRLPQEFLLLTFDNAAATTLRDRLDQEVKRMMGPNAQRIAVLTLNSFGFQLLRGPLQPRTGTLSMGADPKKDATAAVRSALDAIKGVDSEVYAAWPRFRNAAFLTFISALKNGLVIPNEIARKERNETHTRLSRLITGSRIFEPWLLPFQSRDDAALWAKRSLNLLLKLYLEYCAAMAGNSRLDFDDQKLLPYLHLRGDPELVRAVLGQVRILVVDEFQDINTLDFEFIRTLAEGRELVVVGDDDQAIYGFRGCSPDYIINFAEQLNRDCRTHVLEVNYRCPRNIVEMSQRLIRNNEHRLDKRAQSSTDKDAAIHLWHCANSAAEAQIVARAVRKLHDDRSPSGFAFKDIAILIRVNSQSLPIQLALAAEAIPYLCRKEDNVLLSDSMRNLVGLLRLSVALNADPAQVSRDQARLILRCYFRFVREGDIGNFERTARKEGGYLQAAMVLAAGRDARYTSSFAEAVAVIYKQEKPGTLVRRLGEKFKHLGGLVATLEDALDDTAPMGELVEIADRFSGTTAQLVARLDGLLAQVEGASGAAQDSDGVNLLSYFKAKGRQWDSVFLPSVNQKVIPHARAPVDDERRLFYVAMTRASANLFISYTRTIVRSVVEPSQFLAEIELGPATEKRAGRSQ